MKLKELLISTLILVFTFDIQAQSWQFFPTYEQRLEALSQLGVSSTSEILQQVTQSYKEGRKARFVVYDIKLKDPYMIKVDKSGLNAVQTSKLTTRARIPTGVIVLNSNPITHSIKLTKEYYNNDQFEISSELGEAIGMGSIKSTSDAVDKEEDKVHVKGLHGIAGDDILFQRDSIKKELQYWTSLFSQLNEDLNSYEEEIKGNAMWNESVYRADWSFLNRQLLYHLGAAFTEESIESAAENIIADFKDYLLVEDYQNYVETYTKAANKYDQLKGLKNYQVFDATAPDTYDELHLKLEIKEGEKALRSADEKPIKVRINGGVKIDGSAGLFFTTLKDQQFLTQDETYIDTTYYRDQNYVTTDSIIDISEGTNKRILLKDNGDFLVSIGGMAHFYWRTTSWINGGLGVGALLNTEGNIQYLLGLNLFVGRKQRIVLNGGYALGKVKRLQSGLEVGGLYTGDGEVPTMDVWESGGFLGLSYNF
ncbi:MAG: hypothetical protein CL840_18935 [Crocinitomicaceae bacterium]|nr:hypothetical protein [Crocinitomicaceae bacterium]|tara:strand:- start:8674 stop:10116 length:1443 start_codon:yes stop_codon:yes gene_type:complete